MGSFAICLLAAAGCVVWSKATVGGANTNAARTSRGTTTQRHDDGAVSGAVGGGRSGPSPHTARLPKMQRHNGQGTATSGQATFPQHLTGNVSAVTALLERVVPGSSLHFSLTITSEGCEGVPSGTACFTLSDGDDGTLKVSGTSASELTGGIGLCVNAPPLLRALASSCSTKK